MDKKKRGTIFVANFILFCFYEGRWNRIEHFLKVQRSSRKQWLLNYPHEASQKMW
jgi:hypothetical protein